MRRADLIHKVEKRKKALNITIENLAKLSHLGVRTVNRFLAGEDVKLSTVEQITNLLGLDFAGNEMISIKELKERRAKEKALFVVSLVQGTSSLEMQGLEEESIDTMLKEMEQEFLTGSKQNQLWIA